MKSLSSLEEYEKISGSFGGTSLFIKATATWCGPCKVIQPHYDKLAEETESSSLTTFLIFDIDVVPELAEKFKVMSLPTFFCVQEKDVCSLVSSDPDKLKTWVKQCIDTTTD